MMECSYCHTDNPLAAVRCFKCNRPFSFDGDTLAEGTARLAPRSDEGSGSPAAPTPASGSHPSPGTVLAIGTVLGARYEILQLLGQGGMGAVYKAQDRELERCVALKVIRPELAVHPEILQRFKQELILARQVTHKNAIRIFDLGAADGIKFITMEFIEGQDLKSLLLKQGKLSREECVRVIEQVSEALEAAHAEGVVHRDLKPQNLMLDQSGRIFVMDFGIARSTATMGMTQTGTVLGTPEYMSPEQVMGEHVDARSDLFTLGVIFYELLTGDMPYKAETAQKAMFKRTRERPKPAIEVDPTVPKYLSDLVEKCLELDVSLRYQSARDLREALQAWRGGTSKQSVAIPHPSQPVATPSKWGLVSRRGTAAGVAIILLALAVVILRARIFSKSGEKPARAQPALSLAILPFRNASGDRTLDWLGSSVAEMLSTDVGQSARLRTVSSERVEQIVRDLRVSPDSALDDPTIKRLADFSNADTLVTGQYAKFGDQIRIDATVRDLKHDRTTALKTEAVNEKDILSAVDHLAADIRQNLDLSGSVVRELQAQAFKPSSGSLPALRDYDAGLQLVRQGKNLEAIKQFQASTTEDPKFALAFSQLAQTYANLGQDNEAEEFSQRAVELSDNLPNQEKYLIVARRNEVLKNYPKAIEAYTNFVNASPDDADVLFDLGQLQENSGAFDKAQELFSQVLTLDPKRVDALLAMGRVKIEAGNAQAGLEYLNRAQSLAIELGNEEAKAQILQAFGVAYSVLDKQEDALSNYQGSLAIKRRLGLQKGIADSLDTIAVTESALGETNAAQTDFNEALRVSREIGDKPGTGNILNDSAQFYDDHGQYDQALKRFKEALQIQIDAGNQTNQGLALNNIGNTYLFKGDYDDARTYFSQALALREKLNVPTDIADTLHNLAETSMKLGQYDQALDQYLKALDLRRRAGDGQGAAIESSAMGILFGYQGRYAAALASQQDAVKAMRELQQTGFRLIEILTNYGRALAEIGRSEEARKSLEEALGDARALKNDAQIAQALTDQGDSFYYQGDYKSAAPLYAQGAQAASHTTDRELILRTKLNSGKLAIGLGNSQAVVNTLRGLCPEADGLGSKYLSVECYLFFGEALIETKSYAQAQQQLRTALNRSGQLGLRPFLAKSNYLLGRDLQLMGKSGDASGHFAEARRILDDVKREAGSDSVAKRSDLAPIYAATAE
jgi:tetratricopeptide (TPR) repeat protein/predicted Ser/Thr protein kinase